MSVNVEVLTAHTLTEIDIAPRRYLSASSVIEDVVPGFHGQVIILCPYLGV